MIGIDMHGAWVRRLAASLFVFAALGTGPAGAARIEVWSATLTPIDIGGDLGCANDAGVPAKACSTATVLSDDDFTYDSTDYAVGGLSLTSSGNLTIELDTDITTATKGLTLVVSGTTSLAFADATGVFDRSRVWTSTGLSWTAGTAVGIKLISTNTEPTAANGTVTTGANTEYRFAYADFSYRDADRDRLSNVKIVTLPATGKGTLKLNSVNVSAGDTVTRSELDTGKLTYAPPSSGSGSGFASFTFRVNDGSIDSATYTMTIDVTATPSHCTSPQSNELWCATMTVGNKSGSSRYGYNRFTGTGSITPDRFTHNGKTFVVNGPSNYGNPARSLRFVLGHHFDPDYSTNFHECLLSRLGSSRLTLEFGTGGNKKTAPLVVQPGPRIHFDMYPYAGSWASGDSVQVKLLQVSSRGAPAQSKPVATAVRSTTNPYESIDVSWTAVTTVCGQRVEAYEIQVSEDGTSWRTLVRDTNSTALTYTHSGVPQGATRHYRVQAAVGPYGTGSGSGFGPSASATTATVPSCGASFPDEIWCGVMRVGAEGGASTVIGFVENRYGNLSPTQFIYDGTTSRVLQLKHSGDNSNLFLALRPNAANVTVNNAGFSLHLGIRSYSLPTRIGSFSDFLQWSNTDPGWSVGDRVIVRLTGPASGNQVEVDAPTVTSPPAVSEADSNGQWGEGETVEVTLVFNEEVEVDTNGGTPSVTIALSGTEARSAGYLRGSGTAELVFGYTLITDDGAHTVMAVTPDSLALNGGAIRSVATSEDAALEHNGTIVAGDAGRTTQRLTAHFEAVPENHDGTAPFDVDLRFSAEPEGLSFSTVQGGLLEVQGGSVTRAARTTKGSNMGWRVTVTPSGDGDVEIRLPARSCDQPNAVCLGGRTLAQDAEAMVSGTSSTPPPPEVPLTASFSGAPAEHAGGGSFELQFRLSEEPAGLSYRTVGSGLFQVTGASIGRAWRLQRGDNTGWGLRVEPSGFGDVTLTVRATTDCAGTPGVCTSDGRMLGGGLQARIAGPPTLSVADAEVDENSGATLDFEVTLSRALNETVTVGYGTADVSASAGADYTSMSGTLTFAAQETSKTVSVAVLNDGHDEGSETMTLSLSSPSPTRVKLADAQATGTINNQDPMPLAWMVRFGRTVGSHVVDALSTRLEGTSGSHVTVAGINVIGAKGEETVLTDDDPFGLPEWAKNAEREADGEALSADDLLLRSAFHLSSGGDGTHAGPAFTAWGRVATGGFEAEEDSVTMDGDVTTGLVGFDAEWERALAGVMFSQSKGDGSYRLDPAHGNDAGTVESSLTGVYPYMRIDLNAKVSAWALAGAGSGELTLHQEGGKPMPTDITLRMGAVGVKGQVLDGSGPSGVGLNVKSDAMWVGTKSEDTDELAPTEGDVTRLRLIVQGERVFEAGNGATFTPSAEIGLRHDGGDAETGTGVEVGAGLRYTIGTVTIEAQARTLVAHEASGYEEWGMSGAIRVTPSPSGRGLTLSIAPAWGQTGSGTEQLWSAHDATALGAESEFEADSRIAMDAGYGFGLPGNRGVLTPYAGMTFGDAGQRTVRTGTLWQLGADAVLGLEGSRQASDAGEGDSEVRLKAALRF